MKYFTESMSYPPVGSMDDILELGIEHEYISAGFLNGFINHVDIKKALLVNRYVDWDEVEKDEEIPRSYLSDSSDKDVPVKTKNERWDILIKQKRVGAHTRIRGLGDDVVILANKENIWWLFWYDCDVSDCLIGRFKTDDTEEEIIAEFIKYVNECEYGIHLEGTSKEKHRDIPLSFFNGWVSWS